MPQGTLFLLSDPQPQRIRMCVLPPLFLTSSIRLSMKHRISRLFIDAKKILLYSQNDKSFEGYKVLVRALRKLQGNTAGRTDHRS